jgi:hypothetical protein
MEQNEDRIQPIEEVLVAPPTEASLRLEVTDLLLGGLRDVRMGRLNLEQSDVLQQIETALEAYGSYFYPPEHRQRDGRCTAGCSPVGRRGTRARGVQASRAVKEKS